MFKGYGLVFVGGSLVANVILVSSKSPLDLTFDF